MKKTLMIAALIYAPLAAMAMPVVGDIVGTTAAEATAALAAKGCAVTAFEAEDGSIEAQCTDEAMKVWEVYIDPKSGAVTEVKDEAE
jgi:hypothetical protein